MKNAIIARPPEPNKLLTSLPAGSVFSYSGSAFMVCKNNRTNAVQYVDLTNGSVYNLTDFSDYPPIRVVNDAFVGGKED